MLIVDLYMEIREPLNLFYFSIKKMHSEFELVNSRPL